MGCPGPRLIPDWWGYPSGGWGVRGIGVENRDSGLGIGGIGNRERGNRESGGLKGTGLIHLLQVV